MPSPISPVPGEPPAAAVLAARGFAAARGAARFELPALQLAAGGAAALLGPSGCGKTTVLRGLLGLDQGVVTTGVVEVLGGPRPAPGSAAGRQLLRHDVALIPQDARAALDPLWSLGAQLREVTGASAEDTEQALADLGIEAPAALLRRYPHQVSGGQAQRVCLAVALLRAPRLVVADEPTAALDDARRDDLVGVLQRLRESGTAVLVATHDHELVAALDAERLTQTDGVFRPVATADPLPDWPQAARGGGAPTQDGSSPALCARGLGVRRNGSWILRDFDLELSRGGVIALVGPSGAGKTTLAKVLAGHLRPDAGAVTERPQRATGVQMLFQDAYASLTPRRPLRDLLLETAVAGFDVEAEAAALGLRPELLGRAAEELSGGERRRAALLRALSVRPEVLVLDEPTASLDRWTALPVLETLLRARREHQLAYLLITHDLELAEALAGDDVVRIEDGKRCP